MKKIHPDQLSLGKSPASQTLRYKKWRKNPILKEIYLTGGQMAEVLAQQGKITSFNSISKLKSRF
jgi:hypothetical protein